MLLSLLLLSQGQFFSQACKQYQSCNSSAVFTPTVTGSATAPSPTGQLILRDSTNTSKLTLDTSVGTQLCYNTNCLTLDSANATVTGPPLVVGAPGVRYAPQTSIASCTGVFGRVTGYHVSASQGEVLAQCDGVQAGAGFIPSFMGSDLFPIAYISTRTIASGVITSGNSLLGAGLIPLAASGTTTAGTVKLIDRMNVTCNTAGTGAGNVTVALRRVQGTGADICTATYPCATASLATVSINCSASLAGVIGGYGTDAYGTTLSVAACATPPADCQVNHAIYTAP